MCNDDYIRKKIREKKEKVTRFFSGKKGNNRMMI